ncbi:uncharacterized protein G2W53_012661 [Senna tora]|uniref:Uncharacterized protein n=1 Tax=Senna tora TaxID=362788 RepID=A0A834WQR8_9FABA|nr:uncharacterized protein G2W53_012661 [Senna tora]
MDGNEVLIEVKEGVRMAQAAPTTTNHRCDNCMPYPYDH